MVLPLGVCIYMISHKQTVAMYHEHQTWSVKRMFITINIFLYLYICDRHRTYRNVVCSSNFTCGVHVSPRNTQMYRPSSPALPQCNAWHSIMHNLCGQWMFVFLQICVYVGLLCVQIW